MDDRPRREEGGRERAIFDEPVFYKVPCAFLRDIFVSLTGILRYKPLEQLP